MVCMIISFFMPSVSGRRCILTGSLPAMQAAACRSNPPAAPLLTMAASEPTRRAIASPALRFSSSMLTMTRAVPAICSSTSGRVREPPRRVTEPLALMMGVTPRLR